ncbi:MAG: rhodanese-like domain-containing protein [Pseudomonadota bacterium]
MRLPEISPADVLYDDPVLIDARKAPARAVSGRTVAQARIVDPLSFGHAEAKALLVETGQDRPIVVFCVHGHEVSQFVTALLLVHGGKARYVTGGIEAPAKSGPEALRFEETRT